MLLRDGLGGNAKTVMFANVSPVDQNLSETKNSLEYAKRAKEVRNHANKNVENKVIRLLHSLKMPF